MQLVTSNYEESRPMGKKMSATFLTFLLLMTGIASMQIAVFEVSATVNDQDADLSLIHI